MSHFKRSLSFAALGRVSGEYSLLTARWRLRVNTYEIGDQCRAARQDRQWLLPKEFLPLITRRPAATPIARKLEDFGYLMRRATILVKGFDDIVNE
jgi:hypothetical protein